MLIVRTPPQPTNLLLMPNKLLPTVIVGSQIPHQYPLVLAATRNQRIVPCASPYSMLMPFHYPDQFLLIDIPNLNLSALRPKTEQIAFLCPPHGSDLIHLPQIAEFVHNLREWIAYVHLGSQRNCQLVLRRPID